MRLKTYVLEELKKVWEVLVGNTQLIKELRIEVENLKSKYGENK